MSKKIEHSEDLTRAAMLLMGNMQERKATTEFTLQGEKPDNVQQWVWDSWILEKNTLDKSIEDIKQQIISGNFDY